MSEAEAMRLLDAVRDGSFRRALIRTPQLELELERPGDTSSAEPSTALPDPSRPTLIVTAPAPGRVSELVATGTAVDAGGVVARLVVGRRVDALAAATAGTVVSLRCRRGEFVVYGQPILELTGTEPSAE